MNRRDFVTSTLAAGGTLLARGPAAVCRAADQACGVLADFGVFSHVAMNGDGVLDIVNSGRFGTTIFFGKKGAVD